MLTDVDWQVVCSGSAALCFFFPSRWHHCCACGDTALHSSSRGERVFRERTKYRLNLLHSFLPSCKSPASGGGDYGGRGIEMCLCLWRSRGRVLGEGIKSIVLPPCPPQATEDLIWQLQGGTWKDQNSDQSRPPPPFFYPLPFCGGREKESVSSHCGGWVWLFVSEGGAGGGQAARMHIMTTIEQTSTVQPWKPSGRGWEFQGWR